MRAHGIAISDPSWLTLWVTRRIDKRVKCENTWTHLLGGVGDLSGVCVCVCVCGMYVSCFVQRLTTLTDTRGNG